MKLNVWQCRNIHSRIARSLVNVHSGFTLTKIRFGLQRHSIRKGATDMTREYSQLDRLPLHLPAKRQHFARHDSNCTRCGEDIRKGDAVKWDSNTKARLIHEDCTPKEKETPTPEVQDELERAFLRGEFYPDPVIV
jgi:hypothetical protein